MTNAQISRQLEYIASLLEYLEGPSFPVRRFSEMARAVGRFDFPVSLFSKPREIHKMRVLFFPKARDEQLDVLRELILDPGEPADQAYREKTGLDVHAKSALIAALEKEVPLETAALLSMPEMTPGRAAILRDALNVKTPDDLVNRCRQQLVRKIDGFDAELEKRWMLGKWYSPHRRAGVFPPVQWAMAEPIVNFILEQLAPLAEERREAPVPTPWEEFRQDELIDGPPFAGPGQSRPFDSRDRWGGPIRPIPNVRVRRSLLDRIRDYLTKSQRIDRSEPQWMQPPPVPPAGAALPEVRGGSALLEQAVPVGDYARLNEAVNSFEFLLATRSPDHLAQRLAALPFLQIQRQEGNLIEASIERKKLLIADRQRFPGSVVRFYLCAPHSFAAESVFRSSADEHWIELVRRAEEKEMYLDPTGLYRGKKEIPLHKEDDLYRELGLPALPAEVRDGLFEFTMGSEGPSLLIRRPQIRGDLHMHTLFSDGSGSIEEMADKALSNGLEYIAVTDHSKRVAVANGMDEHRALAYWKTVDEINLRIREMQIPITILKGVEVDVLENAELDFNNEVLSQADWVMASLHYHRSQPREQIHRRIETAMRCPYVSAISHPTGKEWMSEFRIDMDFDYVLELAKKYGKCLEMNSQIHRFDLDWRLCRQAKEHGVKIVISTDSHAVSDLDYMRYGVQLARKAGLTADDIINTLPLEELMKRRPAPLPLTRVY